MRYVSNVPEVPTSREGRQVRGLSAAYAVRPVFPREQPVAELAPSARHAHEVRAGEMQHELPAEDRRKTCRRLVHRQVLIELRSGIDRRHHNLLEGDITEHIDEKA